MWREIKNVGINGEQFSTNRFQFIALVHSMMRALQLLAQHENEAVCVHKRAKTIIALKIQ